MARRVYNAIYICLVLKDSYFHRKFIAVNSFDNVYCKIFAYIPMSHHIKEDEYLTQSEHFYIF